MHKVKISSLKNKILFLVVGSMAALVGALAVISYPVLFNKLEKELLEKGLFAARQVQEPAVTAQRLYRFR